MKQILMSSLDIISHRISRVADDDPSSPSQYCFGGFFGSLPRLLPSAFFQDGMSWLNIFRGSD